ncbi:MAG TPA: circadian clock protein KaiC [Steroidobacteraceae bacterium]|nr:circadian clock protein KaiC [Steroidobacteraceae bacterium]
MPTESPITPYVLPQPGVDANAVPVAKASTGIAGLDEILIGGLPRDRTTLVGGGPGSGKTLLGVEFLYRGALAGEPGILLTFEERPESIRRNALTLGWDLAALERDGRLRILDGNLPTNIVTSGEFDIRGVLAILAGQVRDLGARRLVIDAADLLLRLFRDPHREEEQLIILHDWLLENPLTTIITVKTLQQPSDPANRLEYLTDCVLRLDQRVLGQVSTRRVRVLKYRGSPFFSNEYPYVIGSRGLVLMPVSSMSLVARAVGPRFSSGVPGLDAVLGGGLFRGSSVLIGGSSGTGKTLLACTMAIAASARGERVLYVNFEESFESLASSVRSAGLDLDDALHRGNLQFLTAMPEAAGIEEHLCHIFEAIERQGSEHVFVDAINAAQRIGCEQAAFDFVVRLVAHCRMRGATCVLLNQTDPRHAIEQISGVGISSMIDALLTLRQVWPDDATHRRQLLVIKIRGTRHLHAWNTFQITDAGIDFGATAPSPSSTDRATG